MLYGMPLMEIMEDYILKSSPFNELPLYSTVLSHLVLKMNNVFASLAGGAKFNKSKHATSMDMFRSNSKLKS